jgi:two-component system sensor histidine kinase KdpD
MKMFLRDSPLRYLATPIALGIAVLLSYIFRPVIPYSTEYIFLSAVFLAGWMGGRGPGLITAAVAPFVYDYFFLPPLYTLDIDREAWPLILPFFLCALGAAWVSSIRSEASRAKSTIQVNQDRFSRILANLRDIAWTVDGSGKFLYVSPKIDELTGRTDKEVYAGGIKAFV